MSLDRPEILWLLALLPLLGGLGLLARRRSRRALAAFARPERLSAMIQHPDRAGRMRRFAAVLAALALMTLALAGPRLGRDEAVLEKRGVGLGLILDCSRSMLATDQGPSRLETARKKALDLLSGLPGDKVGLTAFAGGAWTVCPPTFDHDGLALFLNTLTPADMPLGGTNLGRAVRVALAALDWRDGADRVLVILSDGQETVPSDIEAAAAEAAGKKVVIHAVGLGTPEGAPIPVQNGFVTDENGTAVVARLDAESLSRLAAVTGGTFRASAPERPDMPALARTIRETTRPGPLGQGRVTSGKDQAPLFVLAAFAVLTAALAARPVGPRRSRRAAMVCACLLAALGLVRGDMGQAARGDAAAGVAAYGRGDYLAALAYFQAAYGEADQPGLAAFNRGAARYKLGDFAGALEDFRLTSERETGRLKQNALYNQGNAAFRLDRLARAAELYTTVVTLDPSDQDARRNLALVMDLLARRTTEQTGSGPPDADEAAPADDAATAGDSATGQGGQSGRDEPGPDNRSPRADAPPPDGAPEAATSPPQGQGAGAPRTRPEPAPPGSDEDAASDEALLRSLDDHPGRPPRTVHDRPAGGRDW